MIDLREFFPAPAATPEGGAATGLQMFPPGQVKHIIIQAAKSTGLPVALFQKKLELALDEAILQGFVLGKALDMDTQKLLNEKPLVINLIKKKPSVAPVTTEESKPKGIVMPISGKA